MTANISLDCYVGNRACLGFEFELNRKGISVGSVAAHAAPIYTPQFVNYHQTKDMRLINHLHDAFKRCWYLMNLSYYGFLF